MSFIQERNAIAFLLSRNPRPVILSYPERIVSRLLNSEKMDWFCRNVLTDLAVYRDAVRSGSRTGAHEKLNKSPEAVGQGLQRIEGSLGEWLNGGALINHSLKIVVKPTEAGEILLEFAEKIITESETFLEKLDAFQHSNQVRLACIHSPWMTYGPDLSSLFAQRVPGGSIDVEIVSADNHAERITAKVREGNADVGITSYPPKVLPPLCLQPLQDQKLMLVFSARYPNLPKGVGPVSIARVISRDDKLKIAVHQRSLDSPLGNQVVHYLKKCEADLGPKQLFELHNVAEIKAHIERFTDVIGILPQDAIADSLARKAIRAYNLDPAPKPWVWGLIYRLGTSRPSVLAFIECMRPLFKQRDHKQRNKR